jgi:tetraacyldisaccharide-1-P 4'-kinase
MRRTHKLKAPIALDDGRRLVTLADDRTLIMGLPERRLQNGHWQPAGALLLRSTKKPPGVAGGFYFSASA